MEILNVIMQYGLDAVILALLINIATAIFKMPLKAYTQKMKNGERITRFLVFFPIILGFGLSIGYRLLLRCTPLFAESFFTMWISSSSLSLTFYAIWEKLFPSRKKIIKDNEIKANCELLEKLKAYLDASTEKREVAQGELKNSLNKEFRQEIVKTVPSKMLEVEQELPKKIILRGKRSAEVKEESEYGETNRI